MKTKKIILSAAIAGLMASGSAMAAWMPQATQFVSNDASTAMKATPSNTTILSYMLEAGDVIQDQDYVLVSLTNGAVFGNAAIATSLLGTAVVVAPNTAPDLTYIAGHNLGSTVFDASDTSGPDGKSTLIFRYNAGGSGLPLIAGMSMTVSTTTLGDVDVNGVPDNGDVHAIMTAVDDANTAIVVFNSGNSPTPLFTLLDYVIADITTDTDTVTAASQYSHFDDAGTITNHNIANGGDVASVTLTSNPAATSWDYPMTMGIGQMLVTVEGNFSQIASMPLTGSGANNITGADAAGTPTGAASALLIDPAGGEARAVNNIMLVQGFPAQIVNLEFNLDGTDLQPAQTFTAKAEMTGADANFTPNVVVTPVQGVYTIRRNGTFFTTNSVGDLNKIKITDSSGVGTADISIMSYMIDGSLIAQVAGVAGVNGNVLPAPLTVPANGTTVIKGDALKAAFPGAMRYDFIVNSSDVQATNVKREATGSNITTFRTVNDVRGDQEGAI